jgi:hypothetical protein
LLRNQGSRQCIGIKKIGCWENSVGIVEGKVFWAPTVSCSLI